MINIENWPGSGGHWNPFLKGGVYSVNVTINLPASNGYVAYQYKITALKKLFIGTLPVVVPN